MTDEPTNTPLTTQQQADDRLLHALLRHHYDEHASAQRERRVARVIEAIGGAAAADRAVGVATESAATPDRRVIRWRRIAVALAASILVALGLTIVFQSASPALASLDDILGALTRPGDRTFRVQVQPPDADASHRPSLDQATLYFRNGNQYVLVRKDPKGSAAIDGYNGQQSWRIRAGALVESKAGPGAGGIPMPHLIAEAPQVDLPHTLRNIHEDYAIERFDDAQLPGGTDPQRHIVARRKSTLVKGPETIEIWADRQTGLPQRIEFDKAKFQGSTEPRRLIFEQTSNSALSADWFDPTPHLQQHNPATAQD